MKLISILSIYLLSGFAYADFRVDVLNYSVGLNEAILKLKQDSGFVCDLAVSSLRIDSGISSHIFDFEQEGYKPIEGVTLDDGRAIERLGQIDLVLKSRGVCLPEPGEDYIDLKLRVQSDLDEDLQVFGAVTPGNYIVNVEREETGEKTNIGELVVRGDDDGNITKVYLNN